MTAPNYRIQNHDVDQFTHAYMVAALWSSNDNADESGGDSLEARLSVYDIAEPTVKMMIADCAKFQHDHYEDIKDNLTQAGHDLWLTRNGHGAGFFDGPPRWAKEASKRLTKACEPYREVELEIGDDGLIHQFPEAR
jgi:hypothetical protein